MGKRTAIIRELKNSTELTKSDFKNITDINRWLLTPLGIWPIQHNKFIISKIFPDLAVIICYSLIFFLLIPCAMHVIFVEKSIKKQMKLIGPMSFCVMAILKYYFLVMRRSQICSCLNHILIDWKNIETPDDRKLMDDDAKMGRFIATLCAIFMYSSAFLYRTVLPFFIPRKVLPDNTTVRPLAYPIYQKFINTQISPNYELTFTTQWIGGFVVYTITVSACSIAAVFTLHACGQLKIVMSRLNNFAESCLQTPKNLNNKIGEIVDIHIRALKFVVDIEGILNEICFVEFIGCTLNICLLGYYLITEGIHGKCLIISTITYSFLMTSFTFNIFIYCHIGELLNQQSRNIGTTAYMIDWYKLPGKSASGLILILAMADCPVNITAGKMVALSYATFCNVLKTAMAYFNLLNSVIG